MRPEKWRTGLRALHHDSAPLHGAHSMQCFLAKNSSPVIQQPPFSPDLAPCNFWLFPQLKMLLKGKKFDDIETIQANMTKHLKKIPKNLYKKRFPTVAERLHKCIGVEGEYFESLLITEPFRVFFDHASYTS
jgi:hypothetical protein